MIKLTKRSMRLIIDALTVYSFDLDDRRRLTLGHTRVQRRIKQAQLIKKTLIGECQK